MFLSLFVLKFKINYTSNIFNKVSTNFCWYFNTNMKIYLRNVINCNSFYKSLLYMSMIHYKKNNLYLCHILPTLAAECCKQNSILNVIWNLIFMSLTLFTKVALKIWEKDYINSNNYIKRVLFIERVIWWYKLIFNDMRPDHLYTFR